MLGTSLVGSTESGLTFAITLLFNSARSYVTIEVYVRAYQASTDLSGTSKKPKSEFHAVEARSANNNVLE